MNKIFISMLTFFLVGFLSGCSSTTEYLDTTKVEPDPTIETYQQKKKMPPFELNTLLGADQIVIGTVTGVFPAFYYDDKLTDNPHVISNVVISIAETLKGNHYDEIAVMRVGGIAEKSNGEKVQVLTNAPHYTKGEEVLLFLKNFNAFDPPKGFKKENHFYLKAYGKWVHTSEEYVLNYEGAQSRITIEDLKEKIKN